MPDRTAGLRTAAEHAEVFLATLDERPVAARADAEAVRYALGGALPDRGEDPAAVIDGLAAGAEPGRGPRRGSARAAGGGEPGPPRPPRPPPLGFRHRRSVTCRACRRLAGVGV